MNTTDIDFLFTGIDVGFRKLFEGTPGQVVERMRQKVLEAPKYGAYRIALGDALYQSGMMEEAMQEYRFVMMQGHGGYYFSVCYLMGNICYDTMELERAKGYYKYYLENEPEALEHSIKAYLAYKRVMEIEGKPLYNLNDKGTLDNPVKIHALNEFVGISAEHDYLDEKFLRNGKGWTILNRELCPEPFGVFDKFTMSCAGGLEQEVFFDISEFFGKCKLLEELT
jgi:tetratricopeptide (TPR) repeat protein